MSTPSTSIALPMKDASNLVGVDYRTIKLGVEIETIPKIHLGPRLVLPRARLFRASGVKVCTIVSLADRSVSSEPASPDYWLIAARRRSSVD